MSSYLNDDEENVLSLETLEQQRQPSHDELMMKFSCNRSSLSSSSSVGNSTFGLELMDGDCLLLETTYLTFPIYGCISPFFVLLTFITNGLVCVVLLRKHMRSCTNAILVAMAVSDTLTGLCPLPCFIYFYAMNRYADYVPYDWCFIYFCLTDYMPTIFHTTSIWLTVALAGQRYVYVCHPVAAKRLCTMANVVKLVVGIYACAVAAQLCRFVEFDFKPVDVPSLAHPDRTQTACYYVFSPFFDRYEHIYYNVYYWFRVVFVHILPCTFLVVLNSALIVTMRTAEVRREALLLFSSRRSTETDVRTSGGGGRHRGIDGSGGGHHHHETGSTTLMLVTVVGLFLLVELPLAVSLIIMIIDHTFNVFFLTEETSHSVSLVLNLVILVSYPFNFFIYCGMSQQFRNTFRDLFFCRGGRGAAATDYAVREAQRHRPAAQMYIPLAPRVAIKE